MLYDVRGAPQLNKSTLGFAFARGSRAAAAPFCGAPSFSWRNCFASCGAGAGAGGAGVSGGVGVRAGGGRCRVVACATRRAARAVHGDRSIYLAS